MHICLLNKKEKYLQQIKLRKILMATVGMSDIKKGVRLIVGEVPYKIVEFQHVKPGKGAAFVRMKMKSFLEN